MSRRVSTALLAAALGSASVAHASDVPASVPPASDLLARDFRVVPKLSDLPESVRHALGAYLSNAPVADADEPWNATDALRDGLARYRLRLVGYADQAAFVAYEHGGRHWSSGLLLMSPKDGVLVVAYACDLSARGKLDLKRMRALARDCRPAGEHAGDASVRRPARKR